MLSTQPADDRCMAMQSFSEVKTRLPELVSGVEKRAEEIVVTRNGKPAAVLVNYTEYERLKETLDVLSDPASSFWTC